MAFSVRLNCDDLEELVTAPLYLSLELPAAYPSVPPLFSLRSRPLLEGSAGDSLRMVLRPSVRAAVVAAVELACEENAEAAMVYAMVDAARECIIGAGAGDEKEEDEGETDAKPNTQDDDNEDAAVKEEEEEDETGGIRKCLAMQLQPEEFIIGGEAEQNTQRPPRKGGRWAWTIGLVGKPSAGKSTFFNAVARSELAKTGVIPFTTIDPNIHQAELTIDGPVVDGISVPCRVPLVVKDVAGLVPGACEGKGKGNRFLNDLCDADVLVHIIDASGKTDENGNASGGGHDVVHDVAWVHSELQRWILDNLTAKWASVVRKPKHLYDMFSGYQSQAWLVYEALRLAGVHDALSLAELQDWVADGRLSSVVDHFLAVRFPTVPYGLFPYNR